MVFYFIYISEFIYTLSEKNIKLKLNISTSRTTEKHFVICIQNRQQDKSRNRPCGEPLTFVKATSAIRPLWALCILQVIFATTQLSFPSPTPRPPPPSI